MKPPLRAMTIQAKLMLLGLACVLATALSLATVGIWQGRIFSHKAAAEAHKLVDADLDHITQSVYNLIKSQDDAIREKLNHDLQAARYILMQSGQVYLSAQTAQWNVVNEYTAEVFETTIPKMMLGGLRLGQNEQMGRDASVVDLIKRLVGDTCTIFQRINTDGDMLRIATTHEIEKGTRAIGTFMSAINPDGSRNPVIAAILRGETYRDIICDVNGLHISAYEPLYDVEGFIIGVLHVDVRDTISALRNAIMRLKIGRSGYVFILGGKGKHRGRYFISKDGLRDGEVIWRSTDAEGHRFVQSSIRKAIACKPGQTATESYPWKNPGEASPRRKIAHLTYYEPWDWVIGASAYEEEIMQSAEIIAQGYKSMIRVFGLVAVVVAFLGVTGTWLFARRMSKTIRIITKAAAKMTRHDLPQLVHTMDAVNEGDFSVAFRFEHEPVEIVTGDELGTMANAFNQMNRALVNVGAAFTTMVANLRDLTGLLEQKVAERTSELEASERKLSSIIDFLPDATLVIDRHGKVIAWNRAMERMTGVASDQMIGKR